MRSLAEVWRLAWAEAKANRRGFAAQVTVMIVNDLVWIVFWIVFFRRTGEVRGWDRDGVMMLLAVLTTAAGITLGLLSNARRIGVLITEGALDATLALPVRPLPHLLVKRVDATNVGDIVFGLGLFAVTGNPTPARVAAFLFGVLCALGVLTGFLVLTGSSAFYTRHSETADFSFNAILLLGAYPTDIFGRGVKMVMYSIVPAAFIGGVQADLINDFDASAALVCAAAATLFVLAAWFAFARGLHRYESGSVWV